MKVFKNIRLSAMALLLSVGIIATQSAFTTKSGRIPTQYQYLSTSTNPVDIRDIDNWAQVDGTSPSCNIGDNLVCRYTFDGDEAAFETFLAQPSTTPTYLLEHADATKE